MVRSLSVLFFLLSFLGASVPAAAQHSPYAHHADRAVASLSDEEVADLLAGEGAGLALAAELNHHAGPKHVIELADSMHLTATQREQVEAEFATMLEAAQRVGRQLVDAERAVDSLFRTGSVTESVLRTHIERAASRRAELRVIHMMAHVRVRAMLTEQQVHAYQRLRGYL